MKIETSSKYFKSSDMVLAYLRHTALFRVSNSIFCEGRGGGGARGNGLGLLGGNAA